MDRPTNLPSFILLAIGIAVGGWFIGRGLFQAKAMDRYVTVKGLAEKEVDANMAIWPVMFTEASNDLASLQSRLEIEYDEIVRFLMAAGFTEDEITKGVASITDFQASPYYSQNDGKRYRYLGRGGLTLQTGKIDLVMETMSRMTDLIGKGVVIQQDNYENRVQYMFTGLNDIKPSMIEEATKKAREAAEKFAIDSDSKVGKIRKAYQGQFSITDRDMNTRHKKKVRVVTTIEYLLEN